MIERRFLMKTTIAYGEFQYQDRIELSNLSKEMIWGGAYVDAFIANEKVDAGRIILIENSQQQNLLPNPDMWKKIGKRWEYFWSAQNTNDIQKIIEGRKKANKIKYERLKDIYQGNLQNEEQQPQCGS